MIITCECGFQDEKEIKLNFTYPNKGIEFVWECPACGKYYPIRIGLFDIKETRR